MICKCPGCNSSLEMNDKLNILECPYCANKFHPSLFTRSATFEAAPEMPAFSDADTLFCKIYRCSDCGAEIIVHDMEISTFCSCCGQPTIVFDRISGEQKPQYILPFRICQEDAIIKVKEKIKHSFFVPKALKKCSIDNIRGIYIPFRVYDIDYYDNQVWKKQLANHRFFTCTLYKKEARLVFTNFPEVASSWLEPSLIQRLEPFYFGDKVPFTPGYLSGYYADRHDVTDAQVRLVAKERVIPLFNESVKKTLPGNRFKLKRSEPRIQFIKSDYVLCPAWFVTLRHKTHPYTFVINGQTGKLVGSLPLQTKKLLFLFSAISILPCSVGVSLFIKLLQYLREIPIHDAIIFFILLFCCFLSLLPCSIAYKKIRKLHHFHDMTTSRIMRKFVKERQNKL